jgi:hypothetical protein
MGWLGAAEDAGSVAGPVLAGLVWGAWGVPALLGCRIALALLTELYAFLVLPRASRPDAPAEPAPPPAVAPVHPATGTAGARP